MYQINKKKNFSLLKRLHNIYYKTKEAIKCICSVFNSDVVILDTPCHGNLGDHAIVLAEKDMIKAVTKMNIPEITADNYDLCNRILVKFIKKSCVLFIPGGGFLGDVWMEEEERFRNILNSFPNNSIIVFPQTIHFDITSSEGKKIFNDSKDIYSRHRHLKLFLRDSDSYNFMSSFMPDVKCEFVPDIVLTLKTPKSNENRNGVLLCLRSDSEKVIGQDEKEKILNSIKVHYPDKRIKETNTVVDKYIRPKQRYDAVMAKIHEFSKAELVITDRLHGMIFATIAGTPCISFNNSTGKVKGTYEWIKNNKYIRFVNGINEFNEQIETLDISKEYVYQGPCSLELYNPIKEYIMHEIISRKKK